MQYPEIQEFAKTTSMLIPDTMDRRVVLPYLVGFAVGNFLSVPATGERSAMTDFNNQHLTSVGTVLSRLNEEFIFDVNVAVEAARSMFLIRWRIVHGEPIDFAINPEFDLLSTLVGVNTLLPLNVHENMKKINVGCVRVYANARAMIDKLRTANKIHL